MYFGREIKTGLGRCRRKASKGRIIASCPLSPSLTPGGLRPLGWTLLFKGAGPCGNLRVPLEREAILGSWREGGLRFFLPWHFSFVFVLSPHTCFYLLSLGLVFNRQWCFNSLQNWVFSEQVIKSLLALFAISNFRKEKHFSILVGVLSFPLP